MFTRRSIPPLLIGLLLFAPARAAEPFRYPEAKHGKGELKYVNGLPVLTVAGTPEEVGEQIGVLAAKPGSRLVGYPKDMIEGRAAGLGKNILWPRIVKKGEAMVERFPAEYRQELDAVEKASGLAHELFIAGNTMFDMKNDIGNALFGCSAMIVEPGRSATGRLLFGRNLDYPTLGYAQEYSLVTVYRRPGKHAFAAVGFPGLVGVLSGMNDAGLSLAVLEVYAPKEKPAFDPEGLPYAVCYRRLLEDCTTVDEAEKLLKSLKRATTSNLAICDRNGGAVFEVTPTKVVRRPAKDGVCNCTNHFCTPELAPSTPFSIGRSRERFAMLDEAGKAEKLGLSDIHKALDTARHRTHTMQTMVFEPAGLTLHLAIGKTPSSAMELKVLELGGLLKGKAGSN